MPSNYCDNYNKTAAGDKDEDTSDTAALLLNNSVTNSTNGHQGHYQGFNETLDLDIDALGIIDSTLGEETTNAQSHSATNHALTHESEEVRLYF